MTVSDWASAVLIVLCNAAIKAWPLLAIVGFIAVASVVTYKKG